MQMNGNMLDTNVIIKYLAGDESAKSRKCRLLSYDTHFKSVDGLESIFNL